MRKRYYNNNLDIFAAQFSRSNVKALQADETGFFVIVGEGIIEKYTDTTIILRDDNGELTHYIRELTRFQTKETPTNGI